MKSNKSIDQAVNHLFRQQSGKMIAVLVKIFGTEHLQLAEDVVQEALMRALETWKYGGMPDHPEAWLYRTARNKAIDIIRKRRFSTSFDFSDPERQLLTSEFSMSGTMEKFWQEDVIRDDFLGMMYACCHSEISEQNQITLILKTLCGFSTKEIARAFLTSEQTISKRLYRTREFFRTHRIRPSIPAEDELPAKTDAVLEAIYLMFNEGYNATHSDGLIREDLISQALLLCKALLDNERIRSPRANALMALMCFHAARLESRVSVQGAMILLNNQDRRLWDRELIATGNSYLNQAATGTSVSRYHYEAAIASTHCAAQTYKDTDWNSILTYYDGLLSLGFDPVVYLNRCLVLLELEGPEVANIALRRIASDAKLKQYYLYYAVGGAVCERLGDTSGAIDGYEHALSLTSNPFEQQFLRGTIASLKLQKA